MSAEVGSEVCGVAGFGWCPVRAGVKRPRECAAAAEADAASVEAAAAAAAANEARAAVEQAQSAYDEAVDVAARTEIARAVAESCMQAENKYVERLRAKGAPSDIIVDAEAELRNARAAVEEAAPAASAAAAKAAAARAALEEAERGAASANAERERTAVAAAVAQAQFEGLTEARAAHADDFALAEAMEAEMPWDYVVYYLHLLATKPNAELDVVVRLMEAQEPPFVDGTLQAHARVWWQHPTLAPFKAAAAAAAAERGGERDLVRALVPALQAVIEGDEAYGPRGRWEADVALTDEASSVGGGGTGTGTGSSHADLARIAHPMQGRHVSTVDVTAVYEPTLAAAASRASAQCACRVHRAVVARCMTAALEERALLNLRGYGFATDGTHAIIVWVSVEVGADGKPNVTQRRRAPCPCGARQLQTRRRAVWQQVRRHRSGLLRFLR